MDDPRPTYDGWVDTVRDDKVFLRVENEGEVAIYEFEREFMMEKYGPEVVVEGRYFIMMRGGQLAWCMDRWTKDEIAEIERRAEELASSLQQKSDDFSN